MTEGSHQLIMSDSNTDLQTRASGVPMTQEDLASIGSIDDALVALQNAGIVARRASDELGDGFVLLDDNGKRTLVGTPFLIIGASESEGDYGKTMVTLRLITGDNRKYVINDGSTGIREQVVGYLENHDTIAGLMVDKGLRASDYRYCGDCKTVNRKNAVKCKQCDGNDLTPATTYYLDTSA